jgi:pimeloyl-ACP methyl ester carboxylesterase
MTEDWNHRRIVTNGVTLTTVEAGLNDGPLVILLHGFPGFWYCWRRQIEPLASAGFHVLVPNQRGYADSDKPAGVAAYDIERLADDVIGLAEALGRRRFSVIGHDWGGLVAWWLALRTPERIEHLAILNAPHPGIIRRHLLTDPAQVARSWYIGLFQVPRLPEALLSARRFRIAEQALIRSSRPGTFTDEDLKRYREAWGHPGALTGMINWYRALRRNKAPPAQGLPMPTLVIWGCRDRFLRRELASESVARCAAGRIEYIESASHWVHLEEAERVNQMLADFLTARTASDHVPLP